jgi:hypothetical protein
MSSILFYSTYCVHSKKFIDILKRSGEVKSINNYVCVDKDSNGKRPVLLKKYSITEVPTLVLEGRSLIKLEGEKAFKWLADLLKNNPNIQPQRDQPMAVQVNNSIPKKKKKVSGVFGNGDLTFNPAGNYANINEEVIIHGDTPYPSCEEAIDKDEDIEMDDDTLIPTNASSDPSLELIKNRDALKAKQFDNAYNKLLAERQ